LKNARNFSTEFAFVEGLAVAARASPGSQAAAAAIALRTQKSLRLI
jgi:hypothetical protein